MKAYVLDANAVLRYLRVVNANGGAQVEDLFRQAKRNQAHLFMSVINLGEVFYILIKLLDRQRALHYVDALQNGVTVVHADISQTIHAATLKHRYNLAYADSFAAALALTSKATLVSADPSYENVGKSLKWMRLPKFDPSGR